jgi:hypothetical protein
LGSRAAKEELELVDGNANKLGLLTDNRMGWTTSGDRQDTLLLSKWAIDAEYLRRKKGSFHVGRGTPDL